MEEIIKILKEGGVILYPTDTVWGLGCDATNAQAVEKIYKIKARSDHKAMIILTDTAENVARYVRTIPPIADELIQASVGSQPLTVILPGGVGVAANLLPPEKSIAIRVPNHDFCRELLSKLRRPLVSTSANISGQPAPTRFSEISPAVIDAVDYVVPIEMEGRPTRKPSSIIKIEADGSFSIIR